MTTLFPGTWELGRKDRLCKNIGKMRRQFPEVFNIQPRSFVLPNDADEWRLITATGRYLPEETVVVR